MLGDNLRMLRKQAGISQQEIAAEMGVSASTIGMYEQNRRKPDYDTLSRLADYFNVSMETLVSGDNEKPHNNITDYFGCNVFSADVMKMRLPRQVFDALQRTIKFGEALSRENANAVASAMKDWALENGATHYSHWFQPMTGQTAEKHESFLEVKDGRPIMAFNGKALIKGEADASSFPSGGLRATFEARGYTAWDCTAPVFKKEDPKGTSILCIPTSFCSFTGEALDEKTPLLKSMEALNKQALRVLRALGDTETTSVTPTVGSEQEYFLIDKELYLKREDLVLTGRTLLGARPPKGQELSDQYYASINEHVSNFMFDLNRELWKLGVAAKTQHNESAPSQYELALFFMSANTALDHNQLVMEMLKRVADRHNLSCLLHEKPFDNVNGSGKHNNWSLATDTGENLLYPGKNPEDNLRFLLFFTAIIAAVDEYASLLHMSCGIIGNDYRLGGHEAPPPIISIYIGNFLEGILQNLICGECKVSTSREYLLTGVSTIPHFKRDTTDRNRTSPFAFTGNKFEFRMVGSSQSLGGPNTVLNTIVAEYLMRIANRLEKATDAQAEAKELIAALAGDHSRIIFNGNNYAPEWREEAKRRGLPIFKNTADAIVVLREPWAIELFERHKVYNRAECEARADIRLDIYANQAGIEARTMLKIVREKILPAAMRHTSEIAYGLNQIREACPTADTTAHSYNIERCAALTSSLKTAADHLEAAHNRLKSEPMGYGKATHVSTGIIPAMAAVRKYADELETIVPKDYWPLPSYAELLFM
ncbi:MAG: glutamine synthetase III [Christensenellales bacterium]|jgi:glutamine synthetase